MGTIRLVCFDFDGTIADTMPILERNAIKLMRKYHRGLSVEEARSRYRATTGLPFEQQVEMIFPGHPKNMSLIEEFEEEKIDCVYEQELFPETKEAVQTIRSMGLKTAVSSSTYKEIIDAYLRKKSADMLFDCVLGFRHGFEKGKHHFDFLSRTFRLPPTEMVFIGDSLKDMERAVASGVHFIGRLSLMNKSPADFSLKMDGRQLNFPTINDLREVIQYLEK